MSNLSDLLPAGAGAKVATLTADGTLTSGLPVALQSDGTVKAISETSTSVSAAQGSENDFTSDGPGKQIQIVHDSTNDKMVLIHVDASNNGKATVATTDGSNALTYGSATTFESGGMDDAYAATFDSTNGKVVIAWKDANNSNYGTAIVGTVSGTSISFGSPIVYNSNRAEHIGMTFDTNSGKVVIVWGNEGDNRRPYGVVGTVSGTSISFGSAVQIETNQTESIVGVAFDSTNNKIIAGYINSSSNRPRYVVGTVSGTSITFGSVGEIESSSCDQGYNNNFSTIYDSTNQRVMFVYLDSSRFVKAAIGTVSGTSITVGTAATITSSQSKQQDAIYHAAAGKVLVGYCDDSSSNDGFYHEVTIASSGNSFTAGSAVNFMTGNINDIGFGYDSTGKMSVIAFRDFSGGNKGEAFPLVTAYTETSTNVSDFVGITNQAISDSASGEVAVQGGTITNSSLLPFAYSGTLGSTAVYEEAQAEYHGMAFDSTNNKIVVAYKDDGNSGYGTAVVGTVSGTSISWGTPVVFNNTGVTYYSSVVFDSSNDKIVIAYLDANDSNKGKAIVGTVSGTSISFGAEVTFANAQTSLLDATFDSNSDKVVIAFADTDNSSYGTAIVGTVSGTSISFGTEVVYNSAQSGPNRIIFDSSNNKVVIAYADTGNSTRGTAIVGTVSGTSITFGSEVTFTTGDVSSQTMAFTFDSNSNKAVLFYRDGGNSNYGTVVAATVSGTSISFGTPVVVDDTNSLSHPSIGFDSNSNAVTLVYQVSGTAATYYKIGTVSGTDISLEDRNTLLSGYASYNAQAFDTSQNVMVVVYRDGNNSNYGTGRVLQVSGASPSLTVGSTYYVQDDGTLATTSSSVTAGKALSASTLLLNG